MGRFSKLRIASDGFAMPFGTHVFLNGQEVEGLRSLTLRMAHDEVNSVELVLAVDGIEVDESVLAELTAIVQAEANG